MSAKEIKAALKLAKEAIQAKQYNTALEQCNKVLEKDPQHYHALVFLGVAQENLGDVTCVQTYRRATDVDPNQVLAWQGLASYHEKHTRFDRAGLVLVYEKVVELTKNNEEKIWTTRIKLASLYIELGRAGEAVTVYQTMLEGLPTPKEITTSEKALPDSLLEKLTNIHTGILSLRQTGAVERACLSTSAEYFLRRGCPCEAASTDELCRLYLDAYSHNKDTETNEGNTDALLAACRGLSHVQSVVPLEQILSVYLDLAVVADQVLPEDTQELIEKVKAAKDESELAKAFSVLQLLKNRKFALAKPLSTDMVSSSLVACRLLAIKCDIGLHDTNSVVELCDQTLEKLDKLQYFSVRKSVVKLLLVYEVDALLQHKTPENVDKASKLCKQLKTDHDSVEADLALFYVCVTVENMGIAGKLVGKLTGGTADEAAARGWYYFHMEELETSRTHLEEAVQMEPENARHQYQLARLYWRMIVHGHEVPQILCLNTLMKAASLDPYHSYTFFWLGRYFDKFSQDSTKARRCFQKAYDLKPSCELAARYLSESLFDYGAEEQAVDIVRKVTETASAGSVKWAWLRLGLYQMKQDASSAVHSLQAALRADPSDAYCWQCLADAYMTRGSYSAAIKAFTKAHELAPTCMYNLVQLAAIKQLLQRHLEAVHDYQQILATDAAYVPALKGLAETHLYMAREALEKFYTDKAMSECGLALGYLTRACARRPDLGLLWTLIGDTCTLLGDVPTSRVRVQVPPQLRHQAPVHASQTTVCTNKDEDDNVETEPVPEQAPPSPSKPCGLLELLRVGARAYGRALNILPDDSVIWYHLGINYYYQSRVSGDGSQLVTATTCISKSLAVNGTDAQVWSALGVVMAARGQASHAQHCLIRALELSPQEAGAWSNLGALYLSRDNVHAAHEAFSQAQAAAPDDVHGWVGQAMVAELVAHDETADLYRHSAELAQHVEAGLGRAHWTLDALSHGVPVTEEGLLAAAADMARHTDRRHDATAWHMYALLLERLKLYQTALTAHQTAQSAPAPARDDALEKMRLDYARVLSVLGHHDQSVDKYSRLGAPPVHLALALYRAGRYQESARHYTQALTTCSDQDRPHVLTMLGLCAYWTGDVQEAKSQLFACVQPSQTDSPAPVSGLMSLCALSLLESDVTLTRAVLDELWSRGLSDSRTTILVTRLTTIYQAACSHQTDLTLEAQIPAHPECADIILLSAAKTQTKIPDMDILNQAVSRLAHPDTLYTIADIYTRAGESELAYRYAHNAVMCHPHHPHTWLMLATSLLSRTLTCRDLHQCSTHLQNAHSILLHRVENTKRCVQMKQLTSCALDVVRHLEDDGIPETLVDDVNFVVEMLEGYHTVTFAENEKENESEDNQKDDGSPIEPESRTSTKIDGRALVLHGIMEILAIGLKLVPLEEVVATETDTDTDPASKPVRGTPPHPANLVTAYHALGAYQFDQDIFSRDERLYTRKKAVKKNSKVKFARPGLSSRMRCLARDMSDTLFT